MSTKNTDTKTKTPAKKVSFKKPLSSSTPVRKPSVSKRPAKKPSIMKKPTGQSKASKEQWEKALKENKGALENVWKSSDPKKTYKKTIEKIANEIKK